MSGSTPPNPCPPHPLSAPTLLVSCCVIGGRSELKREMANELNETCRTTHQAKAERGRGRESKRATGGEGTVEVRATFGQLCRAAAAAAVDRKVTFPFPFPYP